MRLHVRQLACVLMLVATLGATATSRPATAQTISAQTLTRLMGAFRHAAQTDTVCLSRRAETPPAHSIVADSRRALACTGMSTTAAASARIQAVTSLRRAA